MKEALVNNITLILTLVFFVIMAMRGYNCGLVKMVTSLAGVAASLIVSGLVMPYVSSEALSNNGLTEWLESTVTSRINGVSAEAVISGLTFVVLFVVVLVFIKILTMLLKKVSELPVINFIDMVLGSVFGLAEAVIFLWLFMLVVSLLQNFEICRTVYGQIEQSDLLKAFYDNNLIAGLVGRLM